MDSADRVPAGSHSLRELLSGKSLKIPHRGKGVYLPEQGKITSSTGEISIDAKTKTIRVVTPKSEGFTVTGKSAKGNRLSVTGSSTICSVFAGSLDGKELAETSRALILHLTDVQATGRKKNYTRRFPDRLQLGQYGSLSSAEGKSGNLFEELRQRSCADSRA